VALRVAISRLPPSLGEAAAASGMGPGARIVRVWTPLLAAPLVGAALFAAARAFGDYGTAERNGTRTFGVAFHDMWNGAQSAQVAAVVALAAVGPALVIAWLASARARRHPPRQFAGVAGGAQLVRTKPPRAMLLGVVTWSALCFALALAAPEWQYVVWAIDGRWLGWGKSLAAMGSALATSGAVAIALALAGCAFSICLRPGTKGALPERLPWLLAANLFVPPFALLPVLDRISRENESLRDALRAAGIGRLEVWRHVLVMSAPAIALGAAMVFMEAIKELEIAITLQHFGYQSPAIKIHSLARFHSELAIANWVLISQLLMLPALAVVSVWLSRLDKAGRLS